MRRGWLCALAGLLLVGCARNSASLMPSGIWSRMKPRMPEVAPDVIQVHYTFVEGDAQSNLLKQAIWAEADEQVLAPELRQLLKGHGLRLAKLGDRLSPELLQLLRASKRPNQGRLDQTYTGNIVKIEATEIIPRIHLFAMHEGRLSGEDFNQAQGYVLLTPVIGSGSIVHLSILPEIVHGDAKRLPKPSYDLYGFQMTNERASRTFPELKSTFDLTSGEFVLVSCYPDMAGTMGQQLFCRRVDGKVLQSILLVRVARPSREQLFSAGYDLDDFFLTPSPKTEETPAPSTVRETIKSLR